LDKSNPDLQNHPKWSLNECGESTVTSKRQSPRTSEEKQGRGSTWKEGEKQLLVVKKGGKLPSQNEKKDEGT
jgi:hypothetical protein